MIQTASRSAASSDIFAHRESGVQSYARAFPNLFSKAKGAEVWDYDGRRYLDFLAGAGSLNYGHNNDLLKEALITYIGADGIAHSLDLHTCAKERFLKALNTCILEPLDLDYVVQFTGPTGTNAVEAAIKIARKATGRSTVVSFTNGFHGVSLGSLALTGNSHFRMAAGVPLQASAVLPYDNYFGPDVDTLDYIARMLNDPASGIDLPAAMVVETVQGEGGLTAARAEWLHGLQALCRRKKVLLIVDDIQAGCGRTGQFFSFTEAGIQPDIVTLSKSISGFGLPMALVLIKRELDVWKPGEHNGTFRGNNHAFVTAAAALEHYWATTDFAEDIASKSAVLDARLRNIRQLHPREVVELRGRGMMRGICCRHPKIAAQITARAFSDGAIFERSGSHDEVIKFLMPLTITTDQLNEGLDILEAAFQKVLNPDPARKARKPRKTKTPAAKGAARDAELPVTAGGGAP